MAIVTFALCYPNSASELREGKKYEIYKFVQGYSTRLWEVVGTPVEGTFSGDEMASEVRYDEESRVDQVIALKK